MLFEYSKLFKGADDSKYILYCELNYDFYIYSIAFTGLRSL